MGLDQQLADFEVEFLRTAPAERVALYKAKIADRRQVSCRQASARPLRFPKRPAWRK
jgi:hypothetical protein